MSPSPSPSQSLTTHFPHHNRFRWPLRRPLHHRRRLPTVRLGSGDKKTKRRRGYFLVRMCRRLKVKWLKMKYLSILKKMKKYWESVVADMIQGSASVEAFQQRLLLETSFAIPVMGLSFNTHPTSYSHSARDNRPAF